MRSHARACATALSLALALGGAAACSDSAEREAERASAPDWTEDPRLAELLSDCPTLGHFSADTSDLIPVMVEKLTVGQLDVARNFREELAQAGDAAIPALEALIRRHYTDPHGSPPLRNALGVLRLSEASSAHELLRMCLEHPNEDIRALAAAGLAEHQHARPEDYDLLASVLSVAAPSERATVARAMHAADPARFARDAAAWIAAGREPDLWGDAAKLVAASADATTIELFAAHASIEGRPVVRAFLLAALARAGDEGALAELRALALAGDRDARTTILEAIETTGRWQEVLPVLADPDPLLRVRAASLLAPVATEPQARDALRAALRDPDSGVRLGALQSLLAVGDEAAADEALALLREGERGLRDALLVLRGGWDANPGLAERALVTLRELEGERADLALEARAHFLQGIGQVPLAAAAELLLERARGAEAEQVERMSAHRWLAREAGNTAPGRAVLRDAWRGEADALRRFDLLEGASFGLDAPTGAFLLEVAQSERASPWEVLYAAERAARHGPAQEVAPVLKRVALRNDHAVVRPALDCLLWRWYGAPQ